MSADGVGFDLVAVAEVEAALAAHGARYAERIYTAGERVDCTVAGRLSARRLAARFAAKEAAMKALGRGDEAVAWTAVEVLGTPGGAHALRLHGAARDLAGRAGSPALALSLTVGRDHGAALVVATPHCP